MANMIGQAKQLKPVDHLALTDRPDHGGGAEPANMTAPKVPVPAGQGAKSSQINGPYGGKVKA
jgi:hypothetical protein